MLVLGADAEDVVVLLLSAQALPFRIVGHARKIGPQSLKLLLSYVTLAIGKLSTYPEARATYPP